MRIPFFIFFLYLQHIHQRTNEMKKILTILLLASFLAMPVGIRAADKKNALVVLTKDKAQHQFLLTDKPNVTFEGKNLKVKVAKNTATFALTDVIRFTYKKVDPTGIDEPVAEPAELSFDDGILVISNIKAGTVVSVYTLDGKPVQQMKPARTGTYRLNLSQLPSGVYVVKAGTITYKIAKP